VPVRSRPFSGDDAHVLADIVVAATAIDPRCSYWHVGDVWWGLYQNTVFDPRDNIWLWIDDGTPVGFAWFDSRGVSVQVCPGYVNADALEDEMLSWAEHHRRALPVGSDGASMLMATAFEHDARRAALLARRGYERTGTPMYHFHRSLSEPIPAASPLPGITVRHVGGEDEWPERVATHREVWHPSRVTLEAYQRLRVTPGYTPELDLVAVTPDGTFASYCICWLDPVNRTGEFEPVGTRPAFRQQGLGKAVIAEGLRRLKAHGATDAIVYTPHYNGSAVALYESAGFRIAGSEYDYVKRV
jgi:ribosomal protein S18 acetylase RimI-like enzyme